MWSYFLSIFCWMSRTSVRFFITCPGISLFICRGPTRIDLVSLAVDGVPMAHRSWGWLITTSRSVGTSSGSPHLVVLVESLSTVPCTDSSPSTAPAGGTAGLNNLEGFWGRPRKSPRKSPLVLTFHLDVGCTYADENPKAFMHNLDMHSIACKKTLVLLPITYLEGNVSLFCLSVNGWWETGRDWGSKNYPQKGHGTRDWGTSLPF